MNEAFERQFVSDYLSPAHTRAMCLAKCHQWHKEIALLCGRFTARATFVTRATYAANI